jgi:hypothetical protein
MPILPIDLQTLFTQMNQVGKDQAVMKEGAEIQASMHNMQIAKQTEQKDNSVNQSEDVGKGIEKTKNENRKGQDKKKRKKDKDDSGPAGQKQEYFTDPSLGRHIDIES